MNQSAELVLRSPDINNRFLIRTNDDVQRSRALFVQYLVSKENLPSIEKIAHKICGSGALFGFEALSKCARAVESIAASRECAELGANLEVAMTALEEQVASEMRFRVSAS
jgi:HPt (histidine-containing phosphotransfer) domain-containing protein